MTRGRPRAVAGAAALLVLALAGCQRGDTPTSPQVLGRETGLAFERAFQAEHRMTTGRFDEEILQLVSSSCRPPAPGLPPAVAGQWTCDIYYRTRRGGEGWASYSVRLEARGCFTATSADFEPRAYERVLRRFSPNPLARFHSCP